MDADLIERLSEAVHDGWMAEKQAQGFANHVWDINRAWFDPGSDRGAYCRAPGCGLGPDKHHPDMLSYADLSESTKEYDRATVRAVLRAFDAAGLAVVTLDDLRRLGKAVGLLNSMVLCGEPHSEASRAVVMATSYRILSRDIPGEEAS